jgi:hypothetical protein
MTSKLLTALAFGLVCGTANAETVTQLIHFDDANNGDKTYTTADGNFFFDPTNFDSGNCADSVLSVGNGSCLGEGTGQNGLDPTMTRLTENFKFTLDSFYFIFLGNGSSNELSVTDGTNTQTFSLGMSYLGLVTKYDDGSAAGDLEHNVGYVANLSSLLGFKDVLSVNWFADASANTRIDCVVATFDGTTTEPLSGFTSGCGISGGGGGGGGGVVPIPATLPLLAGAILGAGALLRRKRKS